MCKCLAPQQACNGGQNAPSESIAASNCSLDARGMQGTVADLVQEFLEDKGEDRNSLQIHVYQSNTLAILVRLSSKNVLWEKYEKSLHSSFYILHSSRFSISAFSGTEGQEQASIAIENKKAIKAITFSI